MKPGGCWFVVEAIVVGSRWNPMFTLLGTNTFVHVMHAHDSGCMHDVVCAYVCACHACSCHVYPESCLAKIVAKFRPKIKIVDRASVEGGNSPLRVCSSIACALRWIGALVRLLHLGKSDKGICLLRLAIYSRLTLHVTTRRIIVDCIRS